MQSPLLGTGLQFQETVQLFTKLGKPLREKKELLGYEKRYLGVGEERSRQSTADFKTMKIPCMMLQRWKRVITHLSKLTEHTTPRMNLKVN